MDASKVAAFKRGQTTYAQVVDAIGAPDSVLHNPDGSTAVAYSHIAAAPWGAKSESYAFVFDRNGVMTLDSATLVK